ncbi:hypothetical protein FSP39_004829 [Pinctada imbricata]|uniref:Uncharacterized protein n=1 Tax=Pinctada imbricata TaxID=66713 RepID=A0AA89C586_PINIB|nr:hypothetical protein FSP39_004829 [Pinctada imbricata]
MMNSYMNGNSFEYLQPGSSTIAHLEMNGINPGSMTTVSLEQALDRVQELRKENSDLRDGRMKIQERNQATGPVNRQMMEPEVTAAHGDVQSLRSQVMTLINEVTESQNKLKETTETLEKKHQRVSMLEQTLHSMQQEMQVQKQNDGAQIENLQVSVKSFEEALNSERKELMNTRKQMADMRMSFNKIVSENKELRDKLEASNESNRQVRLLEVF